MPKPVEFLGTSRSDLRAFPTPVRLAMGQELRNVQQGLMPTDFKPMPTVGKGAYEIRVRLDGAWRAVYVAKFEEAIYVLHVFQKKTQQTAKDDLALAAHRYRMIGE
ncbi:type II toxin-antitoxin system RelE/ParE family toxin [Granulicella sp. 5B5]|uniref:type II toxin-antitoxin system RelE/ParE family toxin n=1 Tax=Granulicella sp. 5B5 TaxID=1617967 RepID=UPI0015F3CB1A|nr:type II toxin-antitoxin system RelE/ParE family toxin [Granulicella sp. 5B5]QMV19572.1 type II toxin-antitoxin system RelE/ParE family toxin [Granulicella sp. 5B5]